MCDQIKTYLGPNVLSLALCIPINPFPRHCCCSRVATAAVAAGSVVVSVVVTVVAVTGRKNNFKFKLLN